MITKKIIYSCIKQDCVCLNNINKYSWKIVISMLNNDMNITNHYINKYRQFEKNQQKCKYRIIK